MDCRGGRRRGQQAKHMATAASAGPAAGPAAAGRTPRRHRPATRAVRRARRRDAGDGRLRQQQQRLCVLRGLLDGAAATGRRGVTAGSEHAELALGGFQPAAAALGRARGGTCGTTRIVELGIVAGAAAAAGPGPWRPAPAGPAGVSGDPGPRTHSVDGAALAPDRKALIIAIDLESTAASISNSGVTEY